MKKKTPYPPTFIALAACKFQAAWSQGPWQQILPAADFAAYDGRPFEVPGGKWHINNVSGAALAATLNDRAARGQGLIFDYDHQTLNARENGQKAPSSGEAIAFEWRHDKGLFAQLSYTAAARKHVEDGEYKYFSPVVMYNKETGDVVDLHSVALTNDPAIKGMARAALSFEVPQFNQPPLENTMNEALALLFGLLGLPVPSEQDMAALSAKLKSKEVTEAVAALKSNAQTLEHTETALAALQAEFDKGVDISKFVPVETYNGVLHEMAALKADHESLSVDQVIEQAEQAGKYIARAELSYLKDMGNKNLAALKSTLDSRPVLAALNGKQSNEAPPPAKHDGNAPVTVAALSADQKAIATQLGISHEDYAKSLNA